MSILMTIPYPIGIAVFCGLFMALSLVLSGYVPGSAMPPGTRFKVATGIGALAYCALMFLGILFDYQFGFLDILAGVAVVLSAMFLNFIIWSIAVWGFTLNMLLSLARQVHPVKFEGWLNSYLGEGDVRRLTCDRMQILLTAKFVTIDRDETYCLTSSGYLAAHFFRALRYIFGISTND